MNIRKMPLSSLQRPEQNVRMHTEKQLKEFERSVSMFGQLRPIVVDEAGVILAGNGLFETLLRLGWEEADVLQVEGLTENQKKKLNYSIVEKEETAEMNQEQFNKMFAVAMAAFRAELRDNDSGEWSEKARNFVIEKGIFAGGGAGADGKPNYMWEDFLSREQAAQILYRFGQLCGLV